MTMRQADKLPREDCDGMGGEGIISAECSKGKQQPLDVAAEQTIDVSWGFAKT